MPRIRRLSQALPDLLTIRQFCALYQMDTARASEWAKKGKLPAIKVGKQWRIRNDYQTFETIPELKAAYPYREIDVAEVIGCTPRNVRYLCEIGRLPFKWQGNVRRFRVKDIHGFLKTYQRGAKKQPSRANWIRRQMAALEAMK